MDYKNSITKIYIPLYTAIGGGWTTSTEINMEKCFTPMCPNPRPTVSV